MKKIYLLFTLLFSAFLGNAQNDDNSRALQLVSKNSAAIGITAKDVKNSIVSNTFTTTGSDITMVYLQQAYKGIPVYNQLLVLGFRNGALVSNAGKRFKGIEQKVNVQDATPAISAITAVKAAMAAKNVVTFENIFALNVASPNKLDFGKPSVVIENITAELMWVPSKDHKQVKLAWQVYLVPKNTSDYWLLRMDALNSSLLDETNLTVSCNWDANQKQDLGYLNYKNSANQKEEMKRNSIFNITESPVAQQSPTGPTIVNSASYRVIPFPAESPKHPGGTPALKTDPWNLAPGNATSLKWHNNGTTDYTITRGNNVWATEDQANANNSTGLPATSTTVPDPLSFNFIPDFNASPTQRTPIPNQQFNTTNLFYWNNIMHDLIYQYGFDEVSGNFQANNQGRGGAGNDYVMADAQDGGGLNNANFSTPVDGGRPRMQMYLWNASTLYRVNTPASIAGVYTAVESNFSTANKLVNVGPVTGQVIYYNDNAGGTHEGCVPNSNTLTGKIALINRGNCNFTVKVKNAQTAGAIAVIMINNVAGAPIVMGGTDNTITIPAVMISIDDGGIMETAINSNLNVTLSGTNLDGDVDNGIIAHEYSHGISNRLTGGPNQSACVANEEQMGEGWSDYYGLMVTQDWSTSALTDGFSKPRAMGTYAFNQPITGNGIRSQKYCTDFTVNNKVYAASIDPESHNRGEIWCATLWDMTWNIINQVGSINPNLFNAAGIGGNAIALKLVTEGMKLQPCGPGFIDGRNAILQADQLLYGGLYSCSIREAFRRRGMGPLASQGSADDVTDQTPDVSPSLTVKLTQNVTQIPEGQNIIYTNTVSTCSPISNYMLRDTLPSNVTYVSGGTYDAPSRVVSFPVNLTNGQTLTYTFTVQVNNGTYYAPSDLFSEAVATTTVPATLTATSTTTSVWNGTAALSHTAPNSLFTPDSDVISNQVLTTTNALALGANPTQLSFWHNYNTETGYDGGVIEISTDNGANWIDLKNKIVLNRYNATIDPATGTPLAGRDAFSGSTPGFIKSSVNLDAYLNQNVKFRWFFSSDAGTAGVGWYVDDILVRREAVVHMRSSLFNNSGTRLDYSDTVTLITQTAACTNIAITAQPASVNVCAGNNATFTVTATGNAPSYQWQVSTDGGTIYTNLAGQTTATLTVTAVTAGMNGYMYHVIVSNTCPSSVTSAAATLTVSTPASITTQPVSVTVCAGQNAVFNVVAAGSANTYQWQVSTDGGVTFSNLAGETASTLTLTAVTAGMNGNQYLVAITSCNPTVLNSVAVTLTVNSPASITTQPANTNACTGGNAVFTVTAAGTTLTYQWQVSTDGGTIYTDMPGETAVTLSLTAVTAGMNDYRYRVIITGAACPSTITSTGAILSVVNSANITSQPVSTTACEGSNASFTATASGVSFQWQVSTDGGVTFTDIAGQTTTTLLLTGVTAAMNNNQYQLIVFSCTPTGLNSSVVTLTVNSGANITAQPVSTPKCIGDNATFGVTATGTTLSYQWQISTDGGVTYTDMPGETAATLSLTAVTTAMNNNMYQVILTTAAPCGNVTSAAGTLTVNGLPTVGSTVQPAGPVCSGTSVTLSGTGASTYTWTNGITDATPFIATATDTYTVTGTDGNGCSNTASATVTVLPLPTVSISASPVTSLYAGLTTTLTATATPPATVFSWYKDAVLVPGAVTNTLVVDFSGLGTYTASVADVNGCNGTSNSIVIKDSSINHAFIYPNPNLGHFYVSLYTPNPSSQRRTVTLYDAKGSRIYSKEFVITTTYEKMEIDLSNLLSAGVYMVAVDDSNGHRLAQGKVVVL
ncbi:MAG: M36 family metallopeptidase [Ferruginibacter sp.]